MQAFVSSVIGVIIVRSCAHDVLYATSELTVSYAYLSVAYFIYDTIAMYKVRTIRMTTMLFRTKDQI